MLDRASCQLRFHRHSHAGHVVGLFRVSAERSHFGEQAVNQLPGRQPLAAGSTDYLPHPVETECRPIVVHCFHDAVGAENQVVSYCKVSAYCPVSGCRSDAKWVGVCLQFHYRLTGGLVVQGIRTAAIRHAERACAWIEVAHKETDMGPVLKYLTKRFVEVVVKLLKHLILPHFRPQNATEHHYRNRRRHRFTCHIRHGERQPIPAELEILEEITSDVICRQTRACDVEPIHLGRFGRHESRLHSAGRFQLLLQVVDQFLLSLIDLLKIQKPHIPRDSAEVKCSTIRTSDLESALPRA